MKFDLERTTLYTPSRPGLMAVCGTDRHWYVVNTKTGIGRRVGPVGSRRKNFFDRALNLADVLNHRSLP